MVFCNIIVDYWLMVQIVHKNVVTCGTENVEEDIYFRCCGLKVVLHTVNSMCVCVCVCVCVCDVQMVKLLVWFPQRNLLELILKNTSWLSIFVINTNFETHTIR